MADGGLSIQDIFLWKEALASCAIEGNKYAMDMLKLWDTDRDAFWVECYKFHKRAKGGENE